MTQDRQEILRLLKYGRGDEVRTMVEQQKKLNYPNEFVPFMDQMIREHKISRKNVAVQSGLSQDYVYKLLRGNKHTDERDYILAMCFAIGMNLAQTQHALSSYGMQKLSDGDLRSHIIILAIQNGDGIPELDEMLEKAGFPLLKTSPDMPSAPIMDTSPIDDEEHNAVMALRMRREFEEIDSFTEGHHNGGNAPFDYDYQGWIRVRDESGQIYQVEAVFKADGSSFIVFTDEQRKEAERLMNQRDQLQAEFYDRHRDVLEESGGQINPVENAELFMEYMAQMDSVPDAEMLEEYDSLEEAAGSEFFPYFLEIDKRTDKKVQEVMKKLDDTREYGIRVGCSWNGGELPKMYIEMFNSYHPELREYFQIVEYKDGRCRYTATHESCFMQIEMGQSLYEVYFGYKREPEYYIDTDRNEFTGKQVRFRFIFNKMRMILHEQMMKTGIFELDPQKVQEEKVELLVEQGVQCHIMEDEDASINFYKDAIKTLEELGAPEKGHIASYLCTCFKIASAYEWMENDEAKIWWEKIYALKDAVLESDDSKSEAAVSCIASAAMHYYREARWNDGEGERARRYVEEVLDLIEHHHAASDDWIMQFEAHAGRAFLIENDNLDESLKEYRKALTVARNHHLDQERTCAQAVAVVYNNYAWVLWNKCKSEEAVLYYGRALDLLESYLFSGIVEKGVVLRELEHMGSALNSIYLETGRTLESIRLKERLADNGVNLA